jgi:hypothetical protein
MRFPETELTRKRDTLDLGLAIDTTVWPNPEGAIMTSFTAASDSAIQNVLSPTEFAIATLWGKVLRKNAAFRPTDSFFERGGSAITAARLERRIGEEFSVVLSPGTVESSPTLRELSAVVDRKVDASRAAYLRLMAEPPPIEHRDLFENGMPGAPGIVGSSEFIARVLKIAHTQAAKPKSAPPARLRRRTHATPPRKDQRKGSRS